MERGAAVPRGGARFVADQLLGDRFFVGYGSGRVWLGPMNSLFHFTDCLPEHLLRMFVAFNQVVQICGNDVLNSLENAHVVLTFAKCFSVPIPDSTVLGWTVAISM
jgi:hypothetical protein